MDIRVIRMYSNRGFSLVLLLLSCTVLVSYTVVVSSSTNYLIGIGCYDIRAANVNMMGYASPSQSSAGVHIRLRAHVFIVAEPSSGASDVKRPVNLHACMASMAVTLRVLSGLKERFASFH